MDTFGNVFGYLEFWEVFAFLWNFSTSLPPRVHWPKNLEKNTSKHVWTIFETSLDIFENFNSFPFLWNFFESPGCTGQRVFPSKKSSKTCLNKVFGNVLGEYFESFEVFPLFCVFCEFRPPRVHWAKNFSEKLPRSMLKTCLNTFGNVFRHFEKLKVFPGFWSFSKCRHYRVHWALFFRENCLKTSSKLVWRLSRFFLDTFEISNFFRFFFRIFPSFDHRGCTGQIFLRKKLPRSINKTCLSFSGNIFEHFEK